MKPRAKIALWIAVAVVAAVSVWRFASGCHYLLAVLNAGVVVLFVGQTVIMLRQKR